MAQPPQEIDPVYLFVTAFLVAGMAGVAALLRTSKTITLRLFMSALLNAGALGLGIAFFLFNYCKDSRWFLLGICLFAGLGGMTALGFFMLLFREGLRLDIHVKGPKEGDLDESKEDDSDAEAD